MRLMKWSATSAAAGSPLDGDLFITMFQPLVENQIAQQPLDVWQVWQG
jgi:hypothetical protein